MLTQVAQDRDTFVLDGNVASATSVTFRTLSALTDFVDLMQIESGAWSYDSVANCWLLVYYTRDRDL